MSIRLRGLLLDQHKSRMESAYMKDMTVLTMENVPCEMVFESSQGFMEHESAKHDYLPVFHIAGNIRELRFANGVLPYHVTGLVFSDEDTKELERDCVYYPSPDELAHMIQKGQFYSKNFSVPPVLNQQVYTFPAVVNLTIVPPPNPAAYETDVIDISSLHEAPGTDKANLPLFYVGILGTGVNRKKDALLDYYGISIDESFPSFVLTAESSGYTDPPLMEYIEEPQVPEAAPSPYEEPNFENLNNDYGYLQSEAEAQAAREAELAAEDAPVEYPELTDEEKFIMARYEEIKARIDEKQSTKGKEVQAEAEDQKDDLLEAEDEDDILKQAEAESQAEAAKRAEAVRQAQQEQIRQMQQAAQKAPVQAEPKKELKEIPKEAPKTLKKDRKMPPLPGRKPAEPAKTVHTEQPVDEDMKALDEQRKAEPAVLTEEQQAARQDKAFGSLFGTNPQEYEPASAPEAPQQFVENTVKPETKTAAVERDLAGHQAVSEEKVVDREESDLLENADDARLEDMNLSDVSDARLQAEITEAEAAEQLRETGANLLAKENLKDDLEEAAAKGEVPKETKSAAERLFGEDAFEEKPQEAPKAEPDKEQPKAEAKQEAAAEQKAEPRSKKLTLPNAADAMDTPQDENDGMSM